MVIRTQKQNYFLRTEPCISFTEEAYDWTRAAALNRSGPSNPQATMVHFVKLFLYINYGSKTKNMKFSFNFFMLRKCITCLLVIINIQRKAINISSHEPPEYIIVSHGHIGQLTNEDVYNHLNKEEDCDDCDNYDHTATFDMIDSNLYSYM